MSSLRVRAAQPARAGNTERGCGGALRTNETRTETGSQEGPFNVAARKYVKLLVLTTPRHTGRAPARRDSRACDAVNHCGAGHLPVITCASEADVFARGNDCHRHDLDGCRCAVTQDVDAKLAFLISGGTGSGKTTLLAALLALIPRSERLLIVEDSRELAPDHPHAIRLEARPPNAELVGAITMTDLVRQSLRMRPDRVVIGEVRGPEISDLLMALNTGHEGGCGTVHANSASDVPARLEALGALGGLSRDVLHAQLAAALDTVVHITRKDGRRWVSEVCVLHRGPGGLVEAEQAVQFDLEAGTVLGPGRRRLEWLLDR